MSPQGPERRGSSYGYDARVLSGPADILFRYAGSLVKVHQATAAGQAWLDGLRRRRPGLWNSFVGDALTMTLGRYQELTGPVRRDGLTIDLKGNWADRNPVNSPSDGAILHL